MPAQLLNIFDQRSTGKSCLFHEIWISASEIQIYIFLDLSYLNWELLMPISTCAKSMAIYTKSNPSRTLAKPAVREGLDCRDCHTLDTWLWACIFTSPTTQSTKQQLHSSGKHRTGSIVTRNWLFNVLVTWMNWLTEQKETFLVSISCNISAHDSYTLSTFSTTASLADPQELSSPA